MGNPVAGCAPPCHLAGMKPQNRGSPVVSIAGVPSLAGRALIRLYRYTLSPLIGFHCRHLPTCSDYADQALARFGLWPGGWMALARLCRCHPGGTSGLDFVPDRVSSGARWYLPWRYGRWRGTNAVVDRADDSEQRKSGGAE
jgi:putative membrane protein insertion efficiency factor